MIQTIVSAAVMNTHIPAGRLATGEKNTSGTCFLILYHGPRSSNTVSDPV